MKREAAKGRRGVLLREKPALYADMTLEYIEMATKKLLRL